MLTANDAIHGWSPASDDDVEVNVSQDMCFMTINPILPSSSILSSMCPPLNTPLTPTVPKLFPPPSQSTPMSLSTGISRASIAPSSDRRAQRNRNRDPGWIPRPRNAFIIFRCEFSRQHAQNSSQEPPNDPDSTLVTKTLSKRAAEAWKQLPTSEKERYKVLAEVEREEHARLYPHYRFRPMKRQMSGTRKGSCERSSSPKESSVESNPAAPLVHFPSVLASAPEKPRSNSSVERTGGSGTMPQVAAVASPELSSHAIDQSEIEPEVPLGMDYNDTTLFYSSPEATLPPDSSPVSPSVELCYPLETSTVNIPPPTFCCNDSVFDLESGREDLERSQALEAYAIGLYNHDLFSPFSFPEFY